MNFETIDRLCSVTTLLADLVRDQAAIIAQCDIPEETRKEYDRRKDEIDTELDLLEYRLRRSRQEGGEQGA